MAKMTVTLEAQERLRNAVSGAKDAEKEAEDAERHARAVRKYREERRVADEPWWIDIGGEGEPC